MEQTQTQIGEKIPTKYIILGAVILASIMTIGTYLLGINYAQAEASKSDRLNALNAQLTEIELQISDEKVVNVNLHKQVVASDKKIEDLRKQRDQITEDKNAVINEGLFQ